MRLSPEQKKRLIANIQQVYLGYLALDFSKTKSIISLDRDGHSPMSLVELARSMKTNYTTTQDVYMDGKLYEVSLVKDRGWDNDNYTLTIRQPVQTTAPQSVPTQPLGQYTNEQIANLYTQQPFTIHIGREAQIDVSLALQNDAKQIIIGGPGKIELYRTHLLTLLNIHNKLASEEDLTALLVALATGTGKTFVQALWMEVLYLSNVTGVFGVPDELIGQFIKDMGRLLPDSMIEELLTLRKLPKNKEDSSSTQRAQATLNDLQNAPGSIIIADSRRLLDEHHQALLAAPSDKTFLSVDEQHLLMQNERRRKRLLELPNHILSLFLTATPDKETFEICGSRPVASMSNAQKAAAGQGRLPKYASIETPFFSDLNRRHTTGWWQWIKNSISISLPNILFPEISSAAQFAIERLPFHFTYEPANPEEANLGPRWNLHAMTARKMLFVVGQDEYSNESVVNFIQYLQDNPNGDYQHIAGKIPQPNTLGSPSRVQAARVYSRGGSELNGAHEYMRHILDALGVVWHGIKRWVMSWVVAVPPEQTDLNAPLPLWGAYELIAKERTAVWEAASQQLPDQATKDMMKKMVDNGLVAQVKLNMFHSLIEYVLNDLTGLDSIQLDTMRKYHPQELKALVRQRYYISVKNVEYYQQELEKKIDAEGAKEISPLLANLFRELGRAIEQDNELKETAFISNWFLDRGLMAEMVPALQPRDDDDPSQSGQRSSSSYRNRYSSTHSDFDFETAFMDYANKYMVMGIMANMEDSETPIADTRPFRGFEKGYRKAFEDGRIAKGAKHRQRSSFQMLEGLINGTLKDEEYTPQYLDMTLEQYNGYLGLGFGGVFISNIHEKGYSDLNLHSVINLAEQTVSTNNSPVTNVQLSGRLRCLNEHVVSHYVEVMGNNQPSYFNPKALEQDNYYVPYFKAQEKYNDRCIELLGINLAKRIRELYFNHKGQEMGIYADALHEDITQEIAAYLRDLNNRNSHNVSLSRRQLARVVSKAMSELDQEIARLRNPYQMSSILTFAVKSFFNLVQSGLYLLNFRQNRSIYGQLSQHQATLNAPVAQTPANSIYTRLMQQPGGLKTRGMRDWSEHLTKLMEAPKITLPNEIQNAIDQIESLASSYNYTRQDLLTRLNYTPQERQANLTTREKSFLLPHLQTFESLLARHNVSKADLFQALNWTPPGQTPMAPKNLATVFTQALASLPANKKSLAPQVLIGMQQQLADEVTESLTQAAQTYATLDRADLISLLRAQHYPEQAIVAGADRLIALRGIVQAQNKAQFLKDTFIQSTPSNVSVADLPLFSLIRECTLCSKTLLETHTSLASKRVDKAYIKIVRHTQVPEMIGKAVPLAEILAWGKKAATPIQIAVSKHIVAHKLMTQDQLTGLLTEMQNDVAKETALPPSVQRALTRYTDTANRAKYEVSLVAALKLDEEEKWALYDSHYDVYYALRTLETEMRTHKVSVADLWNRQQKAPGFMDKIPQDLVIAGQLFTVAMAEAQKELHAAQAEKAAVSSDAQPLAAAQAREQRAQARIGELRDIIVEQLTPIFFHEQVADTLRVIMGKLNREDIQAILEVAPKDKDIPSSMAEHALALVDIIKQKDMHRLMTDYVEPVFKQMAEDNQTKQEDIQPALMQGIKGLFVVSLSVMESALYFNRTDITGNEDTRDLLAEKNPPVLLKALSAPLLAIRKPYRQIEVRAQQGKALISNIGNLAKVAGDANGDDIRFLTRIKNHILRPIWWTTNLSKWGFSVVEKAKDIAFWCRDLAFTVWNKLREGVAWAQGNWRNFRASKKSPISVTYNAETFKAVKAMNELTPLTASDVADTECVDDAIIRFEKVIDQRRTARLRMFEPAPQSNVPAPERTAANVGDLDTSTADNRSSYTKVSSI